MRVQTSITAAALIGRPALTGCAPKLFIRDSGILHALLGLRTFAAIEGHPKLGASWEGFALEQAILAAGERAAHYWATQAGAQDRLHRGRSHATLAGNVQP